MGDALHAGRRPFSRRAGAGLAVLLLCAGCASQQDFLNLDPEEQLASARNALAREKWSDAAERYRALAGRLAGTAALPEARYGLGKAYCGLGDYPAGERELNSVLREFPDSEWADDALLEIAVCHWRQVRPPPLDQTPTHEAIAAFRDFIERFPESGRRAEADSLLGEALGRLARKEYDAGALYLKLGDPPAARVYLNSVLTEYPATPWAVRAQFGIAESFVKEKRPDLAIEAFRAVVANWPDDPLAQKSRERIAQLEAGKGPS